MIVESARAEIIQCPDGAEVLRRIEDAGRTCYKSEDRITEDSAKTFVANILKRGHESVIEHVSVSVRVICDRGVSHELVRHRLCSFSQESTRYCNYGRQGKFGSQITVIQPCFFPDDSGGYQSWHNAMEFAECHYMDLLKSGFSPQEARSVLPNSLKTEVVMTANLREWRLIFRQRTALAAHPQMREIMIPLLAEFQRRIPVVFDDIQPEVTA